MRKQTKPTYINFTIKDQAQKDLTFKKVNIRKKNYTQYTGELVAPQTASIGRVTLYSKGRGIFDGYSVVDN